MRNLLLILLTQYFRANAQVELYNSLKKKVNDTTFSLQYFKNVDSILLSKIDSFNLYLTQQKYEVDSAYFFVVRIYKIDCKLRISISYASQYCDYIRTAKNKETDSRKARFVFAFSFYKNKLVQYEINRAGGHLSSESSQLLTNLISENVDFYERNLISQYPLNEVHVIGKPVKTYFLER